MKEYLLTILFVSVIISCVENGTQIIEAKVIQVDLVDQGEKAVLRMEMMNHNTQEYLSPIFLIIDQSKMFEVGDKLQISVQETDSTDYQNMIQYYIEDGHEYPMSNLEIVKIKKYKWNVK